MGHLFLGPCPMKVVPVAAENRSRSQSCPKYEYTIILQTIHSTQLHCIASFFFNILFCIMRVENGFGHGDRAVVSRCGPSIHHAGRQAGSKLCSGARSLAVAGCRICLTNHLLWYMFDSFTMQLVGCLLPNECTKFKCRAPRTTALEHNHHPI